MTGILHTFLPVDTARRTPCGFTRSGCYCMLVGEGGGGVVEGGVGV